MHGQGARIVADDILYPFGALSVGRAEAQAHDEVLLVGCGTQ
jgi:hypothetical protein